MANTPQKPTGIGNLFGADEVALAGRNVRFASTDTIDGDTRRQSFFSVFDGPILPDPLSLDGQTIEEVMGNMVYEARNRHSAHLRTLRKLDGMIAREEVITPPPPSQVISSISSAKDSPLVTSSRKRDTHSPVPLQDNRTVSFCKTSTTQNKEIPSPGDCDDSFVTYVCKFPLQCIH